jgi:putative transposase
MLLSYQLTFDLIGAKKMPYWRLHYHIIWATKERLPLINLEWEDDIYGYLWGKATALGCFPHAINGMPDHVHIAISIPPSLSVAQVIGQMKGSSSHHINSTLDSDKAFAWQDEYGVVSFSEQILPKIVKYVQNQKIHHANNTLMPEMEDINA